LAKENKKKIGTKNKIKNMEPQKDKREEIIQK